MSNKALKAKAKALKKENAVKKARLKAFIVVLIVVLIVAAVAVIGIVRNQNNSAKQNNAEIYGYRNQSVTLSGDGTFSANLSHGVRKNGTYTRKTEDARTVISFNVDGKTETGRIENNSLYLPREWDDGHGHGTVFPRVNETP